MFLNKTETPSLSVSKAIGYKKGYERVTKRDVSNFLHLVVLIKCILRASHTVQKCFAARKLLFTLAIIHEHLLCSEGTGLPNPVKETSPPLKIRSPFHSLRSFKGTF